MTTTNIGDFPLYVIKPNEDYEVEPFSIVARVNLKEDENTFRLYATCNNIPCELCSIVDDCKRGENLNQYLADNIKELCPELFI